MAVQAAQPVQPGDGYQGGATVAVPPPVATQPAPPASYTDGWVAPGAVQTPRIPNQQFQDHVVQGAVETRANGSERTREPSFFQSVLEVLEFVARCFFPIVSLVSAAIRIGRMIFSFFSGEHHEHIDWTRELIRLGGDLLAVIPGLGGPLSAIANTSLNWWYGTESEKQQGAQIMGGANYLLGKGWDDQQDTIGYYAHKISSGAGDWFNGFHLGFGQSPATAQPAMAANAYLPNGAPADAGAQPYAAPMPAPMAAPGQPAPGPAPAAAPAAPAPDPNRTESPFAVPS
jgi:hypothetical protein